MKEQKTKSKKRIVYYILLAACVLVLAAATVLTVYFVTNGNDIVVNKPDDGNTVVTPPDDDNKKPDDDKNPDDDKPTSGDAQKYVAPVNAAYTLGYNTIYSNGTLGWYYRHYALDFAAQKGTEVVAMTGGTVKEISLSEETGNYIVVDHGEGLISCYRFVEPKEGLKTGDSLTAGDVIGTVAESYGSEASDGEHLHFEVKKNDQFIDPTTLIEGILEEK